MHDVIVVGARCAGAPTAMLLARAGLDVVLVDRARFPSDIMSTHYLHPEGLARLAGWGLLDDLLAASDTPLLRSAEVTVGSLALTLDHGAVHPPGFPAPFAYSPRRTVLDAFLVDAARIAGVAVCEGLSVRGITRDRAGRVTGVSGTIDGEVTELWGRLVVGADGLHSRVARLVDAEPFGLVPSSACFYYTYFAEVEPHCELTIKRGLAAGCATGT